MNKQDEYLKSIGNAEAGSVEINRVTDTETGEKFIVLQLRAQDGSDVCHLALGKEEAVEWCCHLAEAVDTTWGLDAIGEPELSTKFVPAEPGDAE